MTYNMYECLSPSFQTVFKVQKNSMYRHRPIQPLQVIGPSELKIKKEKKKESEKRKKRNRKNERKKEGKKERR